MVYIKHGFEVSGTSCNFQIQEITYLYLGSNQPFINLNSIHSDHDTQSTMNPINRKRFWAYVALNMRICVFAGTSISGIK